jgi:hypothetical protein
MQLIDDANKSSCMLLYVFNECQHSIVDNQINRRTENCWSFVAGHWLTKRGSHDSTFRNPECAHRRPEDPPVRVDESLKIKRSENKTEVLHLSRHTILHTNVTRESEHY